MTITIAQGSFHGTYDDVDEFISTHFRDQQDAVEYLSAHDPRPLLEAVHEHRKGLHEEMHEILLKVESFGDGPLRASQQRKFESMAREVDDELDPEFDRAGEFFRAVLDNVDRLQEGRKKLFNHIGGKRMDEIQNESEPLGKPRNPLAVTGEMLDAVQHAFNYRLTGLFDVEMHAALTTTTYGAPRDWGSNILSAPRTLWETAGIPATPAAGPTAQFPKLTLATIDAGVAEGVSLVEYATSTGGTVTLKRYGRFTDFTYESLVGADAGAVLAAHRTAIARDLDSALIALVNTDAGSAVGFTSDVPAAIRKAIALVGDATAAADGRMCVLAHPDNVALLQNVTSTGGVTIGEDFPRFAGAITYASAAVPTGFMLVANLASACRFWSSGSVQTATFQDVKTGVLSAGTQIFAGFATGQISGYASKVDVVTP